MTSLIFRPQFLLGGVAAILSAPAQAAEAPGFPSDQIEFFEKEIRPVLADNCYDCHGGHKHENGLRVDLRSALLKGSDYGKVVEPGNPAASKLLKAITHAAGVEAMPKKGEKLKSNQIAAIEKWIQMGLPWPAEKAVTETHDQPDWKNHWAYLPVKRQPGASIDGLVQPKLKAAGLDFAPEADPATLCRRIYVTLTGLQPTFEEVQDFIKKPDSEKLTARLLAGQAYGQRWARHWLDVARYADTDGYQVAGRNINYPYAYTYRDWVVKSLNEDMPYDQFLMHQLAADRLHPNEPANPSLAALGFLNVGDKFISDRLLQTDDRIDVVTRGMLGLTVGCARCHNHKYDPIPSKDYYALYSIFSSSEQPEQTDLPIIGRSADAAAFKDYEAKVAEIAAKELEFKQEVYKEIRSPERVQQYLAFAQEASGIKDRTTMRGRAGQLKLRDTVADKWGDFVQRHALNAKPHPVMIAWKAFAGIPAAEFSTKAPVVLASLTKPESGLNAVPRNELVKRPAPKGFDDIAKMYADIFLTCLDGRQPDNADWKQVREILLSDPSPMAVPVEQANLFYTRKDLEKITKFGNDRVKLESEHPGAPPRAMVTLDKPKPSDVRVYVRGNPARQGEPAPRGWLSMFGGEPFTKGSGRLELAQKIASKENPLTARVIVNRIWNLHFGKPLVSQTSDFGVQTPKPAQADLLDYLAAYLMDNGWSLKKLHHLILSSRTWQQSSEVSPAKALKDADNELLSRFNRQRLDFETMRDSLLQASADLDQNISNGRPVAFNDARADLRRSLFLLVNRYDQPTVPAMFDFANPDSHSPVRYVTTVPQQALFLMNSPFMSTRASHAADKTPVQGSSVDSQAVTSLYQRILRRSPRPDEVELAQRFVQDSEQLRRRSSAFIWTAGYGKLEKEASGSDKLVGFKPFQHFGQGAQTKNRWYPTDTFPDKDFGHLFIGIGHGHPGREYASILQWTSPFENERVRLTGVLKRSSDKGNGIRGLILSSRTGVVASQQVGPNGSKDITAEVEIHQGESLYFIVDSEGDTNSDGYNWVPKIERIVPDAPAVLISKADSDFCGPDGWPLNRTKPQSPLSQLAQVLMMSNEFQFLD